MSRSNHNYYGICPYKINEYGWCEHHGPWILGDTVYGENNPPCYGERTFNTRRGPFTRNQRFKYGWKRYRSNPPHSIKRLLQRKLRRILARELATTGEIITDSDKLLAGWYGWWI